MPVGGDWLDVKEGHGKLDARIVLETVDGACISMTYHGIHTISDSIRSRIAAGEDVKSSEYYFRTAPFFETAAPEYQWLNRIVSVGLGSRTRDTVDYRIFEIR